MPDLKFLGEGALYSEEYQDVYYKESGIEESIHVFLDGVNFNDSIRGQFQKFIQEGNLPEEFIFRIAETGFGTGLNFILAVSRWRELKIPGKLEFYSVEKHPLDPVQMKLIQDQRPQFRLPYLEWCESYEDQFHADDFKTLEIAKDDFRLQVEIGDGVEGLKKWGSDKAEKSGFSIDAWFLDGFDPSKNQDLWTPNLFCEMSRLSSVGTLYSTFTTSGKVKRYLKKNGFSWQRREGILGKQHNMFGRYTGELIPHDEWQSYLQQQLLSSIQKGSAEEVNQLLEEGAHWESIQWLYHAAQKGVVHECFKDQEKLMSRFPQADLLAFRDERRAESILHGAIRSGNLSEVQFLLDIFTVSESNELKDGHGRHVLFLASHQKSLNLCKFLITAGIDPCLNDIYQKSIKDYLQEDSPILTIFS